MNDDLIRRSSVKEELKSWAICINHPQFYKVEDADHVIDTIPAVEAVSRPVVDQIRWERDVAIEQLKQHGIPFCGTAPITNADRLGTMTIEEKAEFLSSIAYAGKTPWCEAFEAKFCKSCPTATCTIEGLNHPMELHECDFTGGKCPHGRDIVWWLQQPAEEG